MKKIPKVSDSLNRIRTAGAYGWDIGCVAFEDITQITGSKVERLKRPSNKKLNKDFGKKHGPV